MMAHKSDQLPSAPALEVPGERLLPFANSAVSHARLPPIERPPAPRPASSSWRPHETPRK
jgi:hypothetical protein